MLARFTWKEPRLSGDPVKIGDVLTVTRPDVFAFRGNAQYHLSGMKFIVLDIDSKHKINPLVSVMFQNGFTMHVISSRVEFWLCIRSYP